MHTQPVDTIQTMDSIKLLAFSHQIKCVDTLRTVLCFDSLSKSCSFHSVFSLFLLRINQIWTAVLVQAMRTREIFNLATLEYKHHLSQAHRIWMESRNTKKLPAPPSMTMEKSLLTHSKIEAIWLFFECDADDTSTSMEIERDKSIFYHVVFVLLLFLLHFFLLLNINILSFNLFRAKQYNEHDYFDRS